MIKTIRSTALAALFLFATAALAAPPSPVTVTNSTQTIPGAKTFSGGVTAPTVAATTSATSPIVTSSATTGNKAFVQSQGAKHCFDGSTCAASASYDGASIQFSKSVGSTSKHIGWSVSPNAALAASFDLGGTITRQPFTVTNVEMKVSTVGGGGAGSTVITITDGTNTCTATFACTATNATALVDGTVANGAGTGCVYAAGASLTASVTTAGCTTTQPTARVINVVGQRQ